MTRKSSSGRTWATTAARAADSKKAVDIVVLDIGRSSDLADYVVIAGVESSAQLGAVQNAVEDDLKAIGGRLLRRDGRPRDRWMALDYGSVLVHILMLEAREFYRLDQLWAEAKRVAWEKRS